MYVVSIYISYQLHVVDEGVSVLPCLGAVAGERLGVDVLGVVEVVKRLSEQMHSVVDKGRLSLENKSKSGLPGERSFASRDVIY